MPIVLRTLFAVAALQLFAATTFAGMPPSPLTLRVDHLVSHRVEALSFFVVLTLVLAGVVMFIWNALRADFPRMPRLTYWRSLGMVLLWGMLVAVVLSMISGARELMTPGAWERYGASYRITALPPEQLLAVRREKLERLKAALWTYAAAHNNEPPPNEWDEAIPSELWEVPIARDLRYIYVPRRRLGEGDSVVAYEPDVFDGLRLTILTDGRIELLTDAHIVEKFPFHPSEPAAAPATQPAPGDTP